MEKDNSILHGAMIIGVSLIISSLVLGNSIYNGFSEINLIGSSNTSTEANTEAPKELTVQDKIKLSDAGTSVDSEKMNFGAPLENYESPLSMEEISYIKKDRPVKGSKDAVISWLEFSDFKCGFCQRQHNSGTYDQVKSKFKDNELNFVYMPFTIFDAPGAAAAECVLKESGEEVFYKTITDVYKIKDSSIPTILSIAGSHGADTEKVKSCYVNLDSVDTIKRVNQISSQGFGIGGTPGNILINNQTGEFKFISGAYPASEFEKTVNELLKK